MKDGCFGKLLLIFLLFHCTLSAAPLRRPVSPTSPMLLIHVNYPYDAQRVIDAIPADIKPYVVLNLAMRSANEDGYEVADAWLNTCAQNGMWAMVQPSSGINNSMSDTDLRDYEALYQKYPNMIGYNFCEQTWGFDSTTFAQRLAFFCQLLTLADTYGGYLYVNDCFSLSNSNWNSVSKLKQSQDFANFTKIYKANFIFGNKFTHSYGYYDNQSAALGVFLSGHAGTYAVRFDEYAWGWSGKSQVFGVESPDRAEGFGENTLLACPEAVHGVPILEEMLLHGASVIDGPEVPHYSSIYYDGQRTPCFNNMIADIFRKVLDGAVRVPSVSEVANRTKVAFVPMVYVNPPADLYTGLYEMDGQRDLNKTWFKKTGRYPAIPELFSNAAYETALFSSTNVVTSTAYASRWPTEQAKVNEFNSLFPAESTGDLYAGRFHNKWLTYNPYINTDITANGVLTLKYNTCTSLDLTYTAHTLGVVSEAAGSINIYLNNYRSDKSQMWLDYPTGIPSSQIANYLLNPVDTQLRTTVVKVNGASSQPTYTLTERGVHPASNAFATWSGGVYTLTINHNGPVDVAIQCSGSAIGRPAAPANLTMTKPSAPAAYKVSPYVPVYAAGFSGQSGVDEKQYSEFGLNLTAISNGDWIKFSGVDFGSGSGASSFVARAAGTVGGNIEVRLGSPTGTLIGTCVIPATGSTVAWKTFFTSVTNTTGVHDLYLKFVGSTSSTNLFDLATWQFGSSDVAPFAPYDPSSAIVTSSQATISWSVVPGATTYNVSRSLNSGGPYTSIAAGLTATTYTDTNVANGVTYYYVVTAANSVGESGYSPETNIEIRRLLLPVADSYVQDGGSANSNFGTATSMIVKLNGTTANSGLTRETYLRFNVGSLTNITSAQLRMTPIYTDSTTPVHNYEFVATDSWGETTITWNNKPIGSGTILASSTGTTVGTSLISDVTSQVRAESTGDGLFSLRIVSPSPTNTARVDFASRENTSAALRPAIVYLANDLPAPTGLAITPSNDTASLTWGPAAGASSYMVKRSTTPGGPYVVVANGVTATSYVDATLSNHHVYYYVVSALSSEAQSANSAEVSVVPNIRYTTHLRFDEGIGSIANDATGNNWNGTLVNSPSWGTGANAKVNGSIRCRPSNNGRHVTLPAGVVNGLTDFTVTFWYKLNAVASWARVFDFNTGSTATSMYFTPKVSGSNVMRFGQKINNVAQNLEAAYTPTTGVWYHVAVTHSGNTGRLYLNGALVATNTGMTFTPMKMGATTANYIGKSASTDPYLDGYLDEFQIFDTALGAGEIAGLAGTSLLASPSSFTATAGDAQVVLNWNEVPGATLYTVKRSTTNGGPYTTISTVSNPHTVSYTDVGVVNGTTYYYIVTATGIAGESAGSAAVSAKPAQVFTQWISSAFSGQSSPAIIGETANPDGDSYSNMIEYFLGTPPGAVDGAGLVEASTDASDNMVINFRMAKNLTGVSYKVQSSTDILIWADTGIAAAVVSDQGSYYLMRATVPIVSGGKFFVRLLVTSP